jgi:WD40 repeat protein
MVSKCIAGLACLTIVMGAGIAQEKGTSPDEKVRPRWEYKVASEADILKLGKDDLTAGLNKLGEDGWELVGSEKTRFILKRKNTAATAATPPANPVLLHTIDWQDDEQGFPAHIFQTGISPDGKLFFGAGDGGPTGSLRIFDIATGKLVHDLRPGGDLWFTAAAFVPGGKHLAASYHLDKDIYLWDIATGKVARKFSGHTDTGIGFTVSPDGKALLSWSNNDRTLRVWDVASGKELGKLDGHTDKAEGVFAADSKKILTFGSDKTLRVWDAATCRPLLKPLNHDDACTGSFSPDGKHILSFSADSTIRLWDAATGKEIRRFEGGPVKDGVRGFIAGGQSVAAYCDDQKYRIWDTASGKVVREIDLSKFGGDRGTMTASPDGRFGLANHQDGSVRVFHLATGLEIHRYDDCSKARAFSFTSDGNFAVSGSFRAGLRVYRLPSAQAKPGR